MDGKKQSGEMLLFFLEKNLSFLPSDKDMKKEEKTDSAGHSHSPDLIIDSKIL